MNQMKNPHPSAEDDYSASATLVRFDHPLPLLRVPVRVGTTDNPSSGPYLLAFRDPQAFFSSYKFCESKVLEQCESGVRIGCAIRASGKCKPPWWKIIFGGRSRIDFKARELCEEKEMAACIEASKEKCAGYTKEKCLGPFRSARIACGERRVQKRELGKLISCVSCLGALKNYALVERVMLNQFESVLCMEIVATCLLNGDGLPIPLTEVPCRHWFHVMGEGAGHNVAKCI
ncbi:hypothetical protein Dimus_016055 [Dionaea muscipula]